MKNYGSSGTGDWKPWQILIELKSSHKNAETEALKGVRVCGTFLWKSKIISKTEESSVYIYAPGAWPDFSCLHLLCKHLIDSLHLCSADALYITIFRGTRIRHIMWDGDGTGDLNGFDLYLSDPVLADTLEDAIEVADKVDISDCERGFTIRLVPFWKRKRRRYRPVHHPEDDSSYWGDDSPYPDYDPYILEAGPFDAGW